MSGIHQSREAKRTSPGKDDDTMFLVAGKRGGTARESVRQRR